VGAGRGLTNRVYRRRRILARAITAASAPVAVFHCELVPGQMCTCRGILKLPGGLELLTADVVALWVASSHEYRVTLEDVNVCGVYALPWIIRRGATRARLTGTAPCDLEVMKTRTVEAWLFACHLFAVGEGRQVPGAVSLSGKSLSSASGSVSDSV